MPRSLHSQWVPEIEETECNARSIGPATVGGKARFKIPIKRPGLGWVGVGGDYGPWIIDPV